MPRLQASAHIKVPTAATGRVDWCGVNNYGVGCCVAVGEF